MFIYNCCFNILLYIRGMIDLKEIEFHASVECQRLVDLHVLQQKSKKKMNSIIDINEWDSIPTYRIELNSIINQPYFNN